MWELFALDNLCCPRALHAAFWAIYRFSPSPYLIRPHLGCAGDKIRSLTNTYVYMRVKEKSAFVDAHGLSPGPCRRYQTAPDAHNSLWENSEKSIAATGFGPVCVCVYSLSPSAPSERRANYTWWCCCVWMSSSSRHTSWPDGCERMHSVERSLLVRAPMEISDCLLLRKQREPVVGNGTSSIHVHTH